MRVRSILACVALASAVPALANATDTNGVTPPAAAPKPVKDADGTKVVCRKIPKTGSMVGTERVCATKTEWQRAADETRQPWGEMQGKGSTSGQ